MENKEESKKKELKTEEIKSEVTKQSLVRIKMKMPTVVPFIDKDRILSPGIIVEVPEEVAEELCRKIFLWSSKQGTWNKFTHGFPVKESVSRAERTAL